MNWKKDEYNSLKFEYFSFLECARANFKINKGDIRAFIGLREWFHEKERLDAGDNSYSAHLFALGEALRDLKKALERRNFYEVFKRDLAKWSTEGVLLDRNETRDPLIPPPIPNMRSWKGNDHTVMSLFSGAMGLDLGFLAAGFKLVLANDIDTNSFKTVNMNMPSVPFILEDIKKVSSEDLLSKSGIDIGEVDVLVGGPPCQPFSTAGRRRGLNDPRASPLKEFVRVIKEIKPRAFVMEEVSGLKSSRLKHVSAIERKSRALRPEEEKGSAFNAILEMLRSTGYRLIYDILNAADFGSPQSRNRLIFIGLREGIPKLPEITHSIRQQTTLDGNKPEPWNTLWEATSDLQYKENNFIGTSNSRFKYMLLIPPGGHWRHLPEDLIKDAMGGAYDAEGGKMGFYRRLSWDDPSPTVVESPVHKGTMFFHPEAHRPLSVEEYKRVQGFPDDWEIFGKNHTKYKLIGSAVPVHLSYAIANKVSELLGV